MQATPRIKEWAVVEPHLPLPAMCGRTRATSPRDVVNSIFYIAQSGCQWRLLPKDFPPYTTVQRYFYAWRDSGVWQSINHVLLMDVREAAGREATLVWLSIGFADGTLASLARPRA
jgi:transposase